MATVVSAAGAASMIPSILHGDGAAVTTEAYMVVITEVFMVDTMVADITAVVTMEVATADVITVLTAQEQAEALKTPSIMAGEATMVTDQEATGPMDRLFPEEDLRKVIPEAEPVLVTTQDPAYQAVQTSHQDLQDQIILLRETLKPDLTLHPQAAHLQAALAEAAEVQVAVVAAVAVEVEEIN